MSDPFLIGLQAPTQEQMKATSEHWMKPLRPCLYTHWPERFKQLSFATHVEEITHDETAELARYFDTPDHPWPPDLQARISRGVGQFSSGCFFRLESRSPKDNYWGEMTNYRACFFRDIKQLLYSERILDDLVRYSSLESEPLRLLFREWHPIPKGGGVPVLHPSRESWWGSASITMSGSTNPAIRPHRSHSPASSGVLQNYSVV
ncbi:MAG: hypothetical protein U0800_12665 [Isosphaeraceae bacterium]